MEFLDVRLDGVKAVRLYKKYQEARKAGNLWAQMPLEAFDGLDDFDFSRPLPFILVDGWRNPESFLFVTAEEVASLPVTRKRMKSATVPFVCRYYKQTGRLPESRSFLIWKTLGYGIYDWQIEQVVNVEESFARKESEESSSYEADEVMEEVIKKICRETEATREATRDGVCLFLKGVTPKLSSYDERLRSFGIRSISSSIGNPELFFRKTTNMTGKKASLAVEMEYHFDRLNEKVYDLLQKDLDEGFVEALKKRLYSLKFYPRHNDDGTNTDETEYQVFMTALAKVRIGETLSEYYAREYGIEGLVDKDLPYFLSEKEVLIADLLSKKGLISFPSFYRNWEDLVSVLAHLVTEGKEQIVTCLSKIPDKFDEYFKWGFSLENLTSTILGVKINFMPNVVRLDSLARLSEEDIRYANEMSSGPALHLGTVLNIGIMKQLSLTVDSFCSFAEFSELMFNGKIPESYSECEGVQKQIYPLICKYLNQPSSVKTQVASSLENTTGHSWVNFFLFMDKIIELFKSKKPEEEKMAYIQKIYHLNIAPEKITKEVRSFITGHLETSAKNLESIVEFWEIAREGKTVREKLNLIGLQERLRRVAFLRENAPEYGYTGAPQKTFDTRSESFKFFDCSNEEDLLEAVSLGNDTHCCQTLSGEAKTCVYHGVFREDSSFLGIYNAEQELVAQSWIWWVGDTLVLDNIELADFQHTEKALKHIQKAYDAALRAIEFSNVYIGVGYSDLSVIGGEFESQRVDEMLLKKCWFYTDVKYGSHLVKKDGVAFNFRLGFK